MEEIGAIREMDSILWPQFEEIELMDEEMPGDAGASTVPVYSAPGDGSVRFAKGKASVNLREPAKFYGLTRDGNWALIEYEVSERTSRFGYVKRSDLPSSVTWKYNISSIDVPVTVTQDTFLTDDPNVSQYQQMTLNAGSSVRLLGKYREWYAYVETTLDGKTVRGFVPRACLRWPMPTEEAPEAAARLVGEWESGGGSETLGSYVTFSADGTVTECGLPLAEWEALPANERAEYSCVTYPCYQVYKATERERAWSDSDYMLVYKNEMGYVVFLEALGFYTEEDGREAFSIAYWENIDGYTRYDGSDDEGVNG